MHGAYAAIFAAVILTVQAAPASSATVDRLPPAIENVLALPEDKIDIGMAAIIFAHDLYPDHVDVLAYSQEIDRLAAEVRALLPPDPDPIDEIRAMHTVLFEREGFHYDFSQEAWDKAANYFLPAILDTRMGACVTLPMLYLAVAQRVGLPVYAAEAPAHTFVRLLDPRLPLQSIEVTSGGYPTRDSFMIDELQVSQRAVASGAYMRTLTHRQYLALLLTFNGLAFSKLHSFDTALAYYRRAEQIDPTSANANIGLLAGYLNKFYQSQVADPIFKPWADDLTTAGGYFAQAMHYQDRLTELGIAQDDWDDPQNFKQALEGPPHVEAALTYKD